MAVPLTTAPFPTLPVHPEAPVLEFAGVTLRYSAEIQALDAIQLTVHEGDAVALCGPNGSGKTTLLKLAAGLMTPTTGEIRLGGTTLTAATRAGAFQKIGFLFQDSDDQLFCPTVGEDVAYGPVNLGLPPDAVRERVQSALALMRIPHLLHRPIHHLSGGGEEARGAGGAHRHADAAAGARRANQRAGPGGGARAGGVAAHVEPGTRVFPGRGDT